jgi:hypothetical protein
MARFVLFSLPVADAPRDGHARQVLMELYSSGMPCRWENLSSAISVS